MPRADRAARPPASPRTAATRPHRRRAVAGPAPIAFAAALAVGLLAVGQAAADRPAAGSSAAGEAPSTSTVARAKIHLGIDVLAAADFGPLRGRRVGLLTHPAGVNREGVSTIDILRGGAARGGFTLVALFGPEHGIYGDEKADVPIADRRDARTGLPVYSLYGKTRKPTPEMLRGINTLVVDLQDLGVRSYTYASCLRKSMEACFEAGMEVVVLDRPNPLGGLKVDGPPMERRWLSYVGPYRVPYVHGLTIGELARMAAATPGWLEVAPEVQSRGRLTVIPMKGWERRFTWPETGLTWVPTSPAIPDLSAALGYSMTGLGAQIGGFKHGYGTDYPFRLLTFPGKSPEEIRGALRAKAIPGVDFRIVEAGRPGGGPVRPPVRGLYVLVTDWGELRPTELSFYMMQLACQFTGSNPFRQAGESQARLFNKHVGSSAWWAALSRQGDKVDVRRFLAAWESQAKAFQASSRRFWLYR